MSKRKQAKRAAKSATTHSKIFVEWEQIRLMEEELQGRVYEALTSDDDQALIRIQMEFPFILFTRFAFEDRINGDTVSLARAAGRLNHKKILAFFANWLANHLRSQPFGGVEAGALVDTLAATDTAIYLSVLREKWTETEATSWLLETLDGLVQSLEDEQFASLYKAETLYQACSEYQEAYKQLIGREKARRESGLLSGNGDSPCGCQVPGNGKIRRRSL